MILGALFGLVGGVVTFDNLTSGIFLLFTGFMMVLVGFHFWENQVFDHFRAYLFKISSLSKYI